jgi:hypothetical protein
MGGQNQDLVYESGVFGKGEDGIVEGKIQPEPTDPKSG